MIAFIYFFVVVAQIRSLLTFQYNNKHNLDPKVIAIISYCDRIFFFHFTGWLYLLF